MARHTLSSPIPSAMTFEGTTLFAPEIRRVRTIVEENVDPSDRELEGIYHAALQVISTQVTLRFAYPSRLSALAAGYSIIEEALA